MTNVGFKEKLQLAFAGHSLMSDRNYHTVNELLYMLENYYQFSDQDFNISIAKKDRGWMSIPGLDAFVDIKTRGIWFDDDTVEFEIDEFEFDGQITKVNCITVYEREE